MWTFGHVAAAIAIGTSCGLIANVFFVAVKHEWPANYFQLDSTVDPVVSRNARRYLIFRFAPPGLLFAAASVTAERASLSPWVAVASALVVHSIGLVRGVNRSIRLRRYRLGLGRIVILCLLGVLAILVVLARGSLAPLIPSPQELVANFWAGALAAVGAVYLQRVALVKRDPISIAKASTRKIDYELIRKVRREAAAAGVDEVLALVFLVAEDIQRPRWYRWLERTFPGGRHRTTGIMQQEGARTDNESIEFAISKYLKPVAEAVRVEHQSDREESQEELMVEIVDRSAEAFSEDPQFRGLVTGLYYDLRTDSEWLALVEPRV